LCANSGVAPTRRPKSIWLPYRSTVVNLRRDLSVARWFARLSETPRFALTDCRSKVNSNCRSRFWNFQTTALGDGLWTARRSERDALSSNPPATAHQSVVERNNQLSSACRESESPVSGELLILSGEISNSPHTGVQWTGVQKSTLYGIGNYWFGDRHPVSWTQASNCS